MITAKKTAVALAAWLALIGTPAMARKKTVDGAAPMPPASAQSWTGWYVGGNLGGSWGDAHTDLAGSASTNVGSPPGTATFADSGTQRLNGLIGGGQLGYNYQISPQWVLGWEADIQASGERGNRSLSDPILGTLCVGSPCSGFTFPFSGTAVTNHEAKLDWFGTVRGRVGLLVNDGLLLYTTGGLAYGRVSDSGNVNINAALPAIVGLTWGPSSNGFGQSKTNIGFAAGAGLEGRLFAVLAPNWRWRLEYLYVDLGSLDTSTSFAAVSSFGTPPLAGTMTTHTRFTDNIVRVGLNYQFH